VTDPNLDLLRAMAIALGQLRERLVFVGGCATGLLLTNPAAAGVRPTGDVDAIVEVASLAGYHALHPLLAERGFIQTMEDNTPPFRWFWNRLQLDLVPVDEHVLGFANRWYRPGFAAAVLTELAPGLTLRHLDAPHFPATKFEAFNDRGGRDVYLSHDLEDIIAVVDGRAELADELVRAGTDVRAHVIA
jgi:predicted nucleotidyltransferase